VFEGAKKVPDGMPDYVPVYAGTVKESGTITTEKGVNYNYTVVTGDAPLTVADWYKQQLTDKGWTVTGKVMNGDQGMVSAKKGTTDVIVVTIGASSGGKTEIGAVVDIKK
jgi:hypothetical protein